MQWSERFAQEYHPQDVGDLGVPHDVCFWTAGPRALASIIPGPGVNYTWLRDVLLEFVILVF